MTFEEDSGEPEGSADSPEESTPSATGATDDVTAPDASDEETAATDTDASASTESLVDEAEATDDPDAAAEPGEATGPATDEVTESDGEDETTETDAGDADGTPVVELKGIGPAYSDRLSEADIDTAEDLAEADAAALSEEISVPEKTVQKWIDRARDD